MGRSEKNIMTVGKLKSKNVFMKEIMSSLEYIASADANILIVGESGTGKDTVAEIIHALSPMSDVPMQFISCRQATGSNLSLKSDCITYVDSVHLLKKKLQGRLLMSIKSTPGARVIASADTCVGPMMDNGKFRLDLYLELAGMRIGMPRLYQRQEDIPSMIRDALKTANKKYGKKVKLPANVMRPLLHYKYRANITELYSIIDRAVLIAQSDTIKINSILSILDMDSLSLKSLMKSGGLSYAESMERYERQLLSDVMTDTGSAVRASALLQMDEGMFRERCRRLNIVLP